LREPEEIRVFGFSPDGQFLRRRQLTEADDLPAKRRDCKVTSPTPSLSAAEEWTL
jgi:hypothetical protein